MGIPKPETLTALAKVCSKYNVRINVVSYYRKDRLNERYKINSTFIYDVTYIYLTETKPDFIKELEAIDHYFLEDKTRNVSYIYTEKESKKGPKSQKLPRKYNKKAKAAMPHNAEVEDISLLEKKDGLIKIIDGYVTIEKDFKIRISIKLL